MDQALIPISTIQKFPAQNKLEVLKREKKQIKHKSKVSTVCLYNSAIFKLKELFSILNASAEKKNYAQYVKLWYISMFYV